MLSTLVPLSFLIITDTEEVKEKALSDKEELLKTWKPDFIFSLSSWQLTAYVNLNKVPESHQSGLACKGSCRIRLATRIQSLEPTESSKERADCTKLAYTSTSTFPPQHGHAHTNSNTIN